MSPSVDSAILSILKLTTTTPNALKFSSHGSSGFTTTSRLVNTSTDQSYFIKTSTTKDAAVMFAGEHTSLNAIHDAVASLAPKSFGYGQLTDSNGYFLITEFLDLGARDSNNGGGISLATKLAQLHTTPVPEQYLDKGFGFPVSTCCGETVQDNSWKQDWATFFAENRLLKILEQGEANQGKNTTMRKVIETTAHQVVPKLLGKGHLGGKDGIQPRVVHGDLWSGNKGRGKFSGRSEKEGGKKVEDLVFDPSSCYAHHEFDHGIMNMFGGFGGGFWKEYFELCPKTEPVDEYEDRVKLYEAYHQLNHWCMFGGGYGSGARSILEGLNKKYG